MIAGAWGSVFVRRTRGQDEMRTVGLLCVAALGLAFAGHASSRSVGLVAIDNSYPGQSSRNETRTAAIHPNTTGGQTGIDPTGRSELNFPVTRDHARAPRFARLRVEESGLLTVEGTGAAGTHVTLVHNSRKIASATVGRSNAWHIAPRTPLGAGDHRLSVEMRLGGRTERIVGDELRLSIPRSRRSRIDIRFDDAGLHGHAERLSEDASQFFDQFLSRKYFLCCVTFIFK